MESLWNSTFEIFRLLILAAQLSCEYTLQHTATYCNTLQYTATRCDTLWLVTLQHTATHYNTPQRTATHCNTLQHCNILVIAADRPRGYTANTLQHAATNFTSEISVCNHCEQTMWTYCQHIATHYNTLQHRHICSDFLRIDYMNILPAHCNTLQRTATHCNIAKPARNYCGQTMWICCQLTATHCNAPQRTSTHCNTDTPVRNYCGQTMWICCQHWCWLTPTQEKSVAVCCSVLQCVAVCYQTPTQEKSGRTWCFSKKILTSQLHRDVPYWIQQRYDLWEFMLICRQCWNGVASASRID